ncbi:hypothetical protein Ga0466249_000447 [Sporomusaceae bacterium BoRhaA]|uniref:hypothetical protein n=1 Tax=Pelorhabdus rhamnosifermentans TaxID=2772457 RepID=UPI001C05F788|nr:hypothetical protein [Pelorhabdus rhamnosifermentans]MBU2699368.1 hypothetical protein [Pelorhabdus rhamnosifermentans]
MTTMTNQLNINTNEKCYYVVHPLDDQGEEKCNPEGLGLMALSPVVKYSLLSLRLYLIFMGGLVFYRVLQETGVL